MGSLLVILKVLRYLVAGYFVFNGFFLSCSAKDSKILSWRLGAAVYLISGGASFFMASWWPLLIGYVGTHVVRYVFGDPSSPLSSHMFPIKKLSKLRRISKTLSSKFSSVQNLTTSIRDKDSALDELYEMSISDEAVADVMLKYKLDKDGYKILYTDLCQAGAGQYVKGHWVAASTLVCWKVLHYCLEHWDSQRGFQFDSDKLGEGDIVVSKLISWFEEDTEVVIKR